MSDPCTVIDHRNMDKPCIKGTYGCVTVHKKTKINNLQAENERLKRNYEITEKALLMAISDHDEERAEMLELLKGLERLSFHGYAASCPSCKASTTFHTTTCKLAATIERLEGES